MSNSKLNMGFFLICSLLLTGVFSVHGQAPQRLFDQANQLYQHHAYDSAASLYGQLIAEGYQNPELYFNAGNAHYKARHAGYAVYYFEKALQQSPGNATIEHNLLLAHQQATDKLDVVPTLFFVRWWQQLLHFYPPNGWAMGTLLCCWLLVFFVGWHWLKPPAPRWTKWTIYLFTLLLAFYLSGAIGSWYQSNHHVYAIIVIPNENVKKAPDTDSPDVLVVHEGLKVKIIDEVGMWKKVRLTDGKEGWVTANSMLGL